MEKKVAMKSIGNIRNGAYNDMERRNLLCEKAEHSYICKKILSHSCHRCPRGHGTKHTNYIIAQHYILLFLATLPGIRYFPIVDSIPPSPDLGT